MSGTFLLCPLQQCLICTQVYLGRWQQTDVAIKVLSKVMQNLAPTNGMKPQDPATLQAWQSGALPPELGSATPFAPPSGSVTPPFSDLDEEVDITTEDLNGITTEREVSCHRHTQQYD